MSQSIPSETIEYERYVDGLRHTKAALVAIVTKLLHEIDYEIQQRQHGGNNEDWGVLKRLSDEAHDAVREASGGVS